MPLISGTILKDLDARMGICIDIGHTVRDGQDPSVDLLRYKSRIFDMHVKDVDKASKEGTLSKWDAESLIFLKS